ncbi:hypothetical protein COT30_01240 [Candidatus Micrarchaeota archaeon CG08_land_8_20_14_0_20_49_17]|nr:MAG: hypothetical protein AUJ13_00640 [Candidatus Micrarchaeota archaeon CG1_02_49_24]PIU10054.1 MAG: hypothetical protein COT30_01240 [Candidatus Micrarchaeota archaeon CG08_land_8_20_14_0_20_49_17]PIZ97149.1 MAG: hypothetical protein COX84_03350 [Candidatus Micrarchaeota archaeon CG_4_10_14_0_2_um_filter_49_7]
MNIVRITLLCRQLAGRIMPLPTPQPGMLISTDGIYLGRIRNYNLPFFWDYRKLVNPHIGLFGVSGSGKSYLIKTFLTRARILWKANALILDWTGEYVDWVRQAGGTVVRLGSESLNLLDCRGMRPVDRAKQLVTSLEILAGLQNAGEKRLVEEALLAAYAKKMEISAPANGEAPTLHDVYGELAGIVGNDSVDAQNAKWRLAQFLRPGNDYFARKSTLDLDALLNGFVCVDLHSLPSEENRGLAAQAILQYAKERMRAQELGNPEIRLFIVADEAWKIARDGRSELIAIAREGRKYSFGLIVASQNPLDVHKDILANVATCVTMRLLLDEQRKYVRESLGYSEGISTETEKFGQGAALFSLVFLNSGSQNAHIIIDKIDGEELLSRVRIRFPVSSSGLWVTSIVPETGNPKLETDAGGEEMTLEFVKNDFRRKLAKFGMDSEQVRMVCERFEASNNELGALEFLNCLERFGFSKSQMMFMLREFGVAEEELVSVFSMMQRKKLNLYADSMAQLEVTE